MRDAREWMGALRLVGGPRGGGADVPTAGAPPRTVVLRPAEDPALESALGRWKGRPPASAGGLTAEEERTMMAHLDDLRTRMPAHQATAIQGQVAAGAVSVRRLRPEDGYLWEMPGARVFAIVGVQAFTVEDPPAR